MKKTEPFIVFESLLPKKEGIPATKFMGTLSESESVPDDVKDAAEDSEKAFQLAIVTISHISDQVQQIKPTSTKPAYIPSKIELSFGIKISGEVGIPVVAEGSASCEFSVKATWEFSASSVK